jgi:hypothetical protein
MDFASVMVWLTLVLLIGFRYQVGTDWFNYLDYLYRVRGVDFVDMIKMPDPAYQLINWISVQMDWGMIGVNLICSTIFALGIVAFCWAEDLPWLALSIAIPYLVIVVGMGYTRQAVALSLELLALLSLRNNSTSKFVMWLILAALFHKTAIIILPIAALADSKSRLWTTIWVGISAIILYYILLAKDADNLIHQYVGGAMQSSGALLRLLMNAVPAIIFLTWRSRFPLLQSEAALWRWIATISLLLLVFFAIMPSASTALDRIALYMLPLQVVVFSRLPFLFAARSISEQRTKISRLSGSKISRLRQASPLATLVILLYYGFVQFIWLNFAVNAQAWREYRFYPLVLLS